MSHGVSKQTYVGADAKTTKELTFDLLDKIYVTAEELKKCHNDHLERCDKRFKDIEKDKSRDSKRASAWGFIGGFIAAAIYFVKNLFEK